jgi:hypothetical protein
MLNFFFFLKKEDPIKEVQWSKFRKADLPISRSLQYVIY